MKPRLVDDQRVGSGVLTVLTTRCVGQNSHWGPVHLIRLLICPGCNLEKTQISDTLAYADVMTALSDAEQLLGRPVNPSIYTMEQLNDRLKQENTFLNRVMEQPKLWVKGSDDDIGTLGQPGKGQTVKTGAS